MSKKEDDLIRLLLSSCVRNHYNGAGKYTQRSSDQIMPTIAMLERLGFKLATHYEYGNDAPRNGWSGDYCKLTGWGLRKMRKLHPELIRVTPPKPLCKAEILRNRCKEGRITRIRIEDAFAGIDSDDPSGIYSQIRAWFAGMTLDNALLLTQL